ncbi:fucolectin-5-like, partial [Asterias amurensis]|uniref:fucolectin-5-like n=1 Tax=Asterias amurensis TaxID=7602 RepID=UPI003AB7B192
MARSQGGFESTRMNLVTIFTVFVSCHLCLAFAAKFVALSLSGKSVSQSTDYGTKYLAGNAIDGNPRTTSHTAGSDGSVDAHPWWRVDLGEEHCLGKIIVTLRTDCCGSRFTGAVARAGLGSEYYENQQCGSPATASQSSAGASITFLCDPPVSARYVTLDIDHSTP